MRINVVGFAIDDADLKAAFRYWADLGGGEFYDTANAGELGASMRAALKTRFALVNAAGAVVAEGTVGGEAVSTPPGSYTLRAGAREVPVTVESGKESRVTVDR